MNWELVRDQYYITLTTEACSLYGSSNKLFEKNVYSFHRSQGVTSSLLLEVGGSSPPITTIHSKGFRGLANI